MLCENIFMNLLNERINEYERYYFIVLYDDCCLYEIVILNYFLKFTDSEMLFCSIHGQSVKAMEGYSINCDVSLEELDFSSVRSLIVPGGEIKNIDNNKVLDVINILNNKKVVVAGICAGVDLLDKAGILKNIVQHILLIWIV